MTLDIMGAINPNPMGIISLIMWSVQLNAHSPWLNFVALQSFNPFRRRNPCPTLHGGPTTNIGFTRNNRIIFPHGFYCFEHFIMLSTVPS